MIDFVKGGRIGIRCFVYISRISMRCFVQDNKIDIRCFVEGRRIGGRYFGKGLDICINGSRNGMRCLPRVHVAELARNIFQGYQNRCGCVFFQDNNISVRCFAQGGRIGVRCFG